MSKRGHTEKYSKFGLKYSHETNADNLINMVHPLITSELPIRIRSKLCSAHNVNKIIMTIYGSNVTLNNNYDITYSNKGLN